MNWESYWYGFLTMSVIFGLVEFANWRLGQVSDIYFRVLRVFAQDPEQTLNAWRLCKQYAERYGEVISISLATRAIGRAAHWQHITRRQVVPNAKDQRIYQINQRGLSYLERWSA